MPKPSNGVIDVDYETDNPDNGNRTIIEIGIGKCASLTCNVSYAGSDKQFIMHKRDGKLYCCFPFLRTGSMCQFSRVNESEGTNTWL